jgi:hypothetical protein
MFWDKLNKYNSFYPAINVVYCRPENLLPADTDTYDPNNLPNTIQLLYLHSLYSVLPATKVYSLMVPAGRANHSQPEVVPSNPVNLINKTHYFTYFMITLCETELVPTCTFTRYTPDGMCETGI